MKKDATKRKTPTGKSAAAGHSTVGLDLRDRSSRYCALDEGGEVILERSVPTTKKGLDQVFGSMARSRIAVEVGTHSPWISRLLTRMGHEVLVANARRLRLISSITRKDDKLDAKTLARLARVDPQLLSPIRHRSEQAQADLILIRARAALVETRTALINAVRGFTKSNGERLATCASYQVNEGMGDALSAPLQEALSPLLFEIGLCAGICGGAQFKPLS